MKTQAGGLKQLRMQRFATRIEDEIRRYDRRHIVPVDRKWACLCPDTRKPHLLEPCPHIHLTASLSGHPDSSKNTMDR